MGVVKKDTGSSDYSSDTHETYFRAFPVPGGSRRASSSSFGSSVNSSLGSSCAWCTGATGGGGGIWGQSEWSELVQGGVSTFGLKVQDQTNKQTNKQTNEQGAQGHLTRALACASL